MSVHVLCVCSVCALCGCLLVSFVPCAHLPPPFFFSLFLSIFAYAQLQGSDEKYLAKQHAALEKHEHYIKGKDKTRWDQEFGVRHFAGDVTYCIDGFLAKNKDVVQDMLFELMHESTLAFVRDLTKFRNLLDVDRKVILGSKLRRNQSIMRRRGRFH